MVTSLFFINKNPPESIITKPWKPRREWIPFFDTDSCALGLLMISNAFLDEAPDVL